MTKTAKRFFGVGLLVLSIVCIVALTNSFNAPENFPINKTFLINEGESIKSVSNRLKEEGYIKSALLFRLFLSGYNHDRKIQLGYYQFPEVEILPLLVESIITNGPTFPFGKLTVPEGRTNKEIAELIHRALPSLEEKSVLSEIEKQKASGFLFPETYYLVPSMKEDEIIARMQSMFIKKTEGMFTENLSSLTEENKNKILDVVILASILEGEAKTQEDMKIVSGILQKRLRIGMALQVDVALETYKARGLPKYPINNPGVISLDAALHPTDSDYLYYITGRDGKMYYAKTFTEHKKNIQKYLR